VKIIVPTKLLIPYNQAFIRY